MDQQLEFRTRGMERMPIFVPMSMCYLTVLLSDTPVASFLL